MNKDFCYVWYIDLIKFDEKAVIISIDFGPFWMVIPFLVFCRFLYMSNWRIWVSNNSLAYPIVVTVLTLQGLSLSINCIATLYQETNGPCYDVVIWICFGFLAVWLTDAYQKTLS